VRWGYSLPFDLATLDGLYPSHDGYVDQVVEVTHDNIRNQYIDAADGQRSIASASQSDVGARR
jgi:Alpha/beta hydrolase domain